ncbi:MAG: IS110 family transposase [Pseudonocardiales bacterium]|nr:IS110 family transposase [Pseudonocardiales bacterium]
MPQPIQDDQDDNAGGEVILGVDTHQDLHAAAVISPLGVLLSSEMFPATAAGYETLLAWAGSFGLLRRAGVECTGSYGAALARHLRAAGIQVIEVNQPDKATRRRRGKTDTLDAEAAARAVLSGRATGSAKAGDGPVEMLRMFKLAKASAVKARTQTINQLKAVLVAADPHLRETLSGLSNLLLIRRCTQLKVATPQDTASAAAYTLRLLAQRILTLTSEIRDLEHQITAAVTSHTPTLLTRRGIGPDNAAALLIAAGDNPDRLRSEASFAALCGVSPLEASSGRTSRRRLNRGGDRQANSALYRIALSRLRWDTRTRDYLTRCITEGKTRREAIRCLKRYIAREIYQIITAPPETKPSTA